jgi:Protein of unknown function (DUF2786)
VTNPTPLRTAEDMLRKIKGLLATAESYAEQGNDAAALLYVEKAAELQSRYSIDHAMLEAAGKAEHKTQIVKRTWDLIGPHGRRRVVLASNIAHATGCQGYYSHGYGRSAYSYTAFGYPADIEAADHYIASLTRQMDIELLAALKKKKIEDRDTPRYYRETTQAFSINFITHYAKDIGWRLTKVLRDAEKAAAAEKAGADAAAHGVDEKDVTVEEVAVAAKSVALVLANKKERIKEEISARVGPLGKGSGVGTVGGGGGAAAGRAAAARASITRGSVGGGGGGALGSGG